MRRLGHTEAGVRVNRRGREGVWLAIGGQGPDLVLRLQRMYLRQVVRVVKRVGAPQDNHVAGRETDMGHARRHGAFPARAGEEIGHALLAAGVGADAVLDNHPQVHQFKGEEAALDFRVSKHLGLGQVQPGHRVQGVGIGGRHAAVGGRRVTGDIEKGAGGRAHGLN